MCRVQRFKEYLQADGKSPATLTSYIGDVAGFLRWVESKGGQQEQDFSRFHVTSYRRYLLEADYEVATINKKLNSLLCFNHYLVAQKQMTELVVHLRKDKVRVASGSEKQVEIYTDQEVERLQFHIQDPKQVSQRDKAVIVTLLMTGVRVSELTNIRRKDLAGVYKLSSRQLKTPTSKALQPAPRIT